MFGAMSPCHSISFVSQASLDNNVVQSYGLKKKIIAVKNCRKLTKADMKFNDYTPKLVVDSEHFTVSCDNVVLTCEPAKTLPLTQRFFLF